MKNEIMIKDWFKSKMDLDGGFLVEVVTVERETEKAYLLCVTIGYGNATFSK